MAGSIGKLGHNVLKFFEPKFHENTQIILVNIVTLLSNLMTNGVTKSRNIFTTQKYVIFFCFTKGSDFTFFGK